MTAFFTAAKMYSLCSIPLMSNLNLYTKVNTFRTSVQCHIASMTFKNGKLALFHVCDYSYYANVHGVTIENNRSYLKNNRYTGENNRGNF